MNTYINILNLIERPIAFQSGQSTLSIAPAIEAKPTRDRVQIAPRIHGNIKQPFAVDVSSAVMVSERMKELSE
jgi:hypothetical protein